ncbi:MAG: hypothetical protein RLN60_02085 [Phycisphaerales bacterium]
MTNRRVIGFDREIRAEWLDAVAAKVSDGGSPRDVRNWLDTFLADQLGGKGGGGNRGKTITVLSRIWSNVPKPCREIRDRALNLLQHVDSEERLAIHWAMATAVYPFFGDVTATVGRLLALQGDVERHAVLKRLSETWGERPAVSRACRAIWSSLAQWSAMKEGGRRGRYCQLDRKHPASMEVTRLLLESVIRSSDRLAMPLSAISTWPGLFPFELTDISASIAHSTEITVSREGIDLEMVRAIKSDRPQAGNLDPRLRSPVNSRDHEASLFEIGKDDRPSRAQPAARSGD